MVMLQQLMGRGAVCTMTEKPRERETIAIRFFLDYAFCSSSRRTSMSSRSLVLTFWHLSFRREAQLVVGLNGKISTGNLRYVSRT